MCVCVTFLIKNWPNLKEIGFSIDFYNLVGARQYSQKIKNKNNITFDCYNLTIQKESTNAIFFYNNL